MKSYFRGKTSTQSWQRTLRSCFLSSFVEFCSAVSEEKSKRSKPIRDQGGHLVFFFDRPKKNTNLVEDIKTSKVLLNSVQWFQRRSRKCEKLTTDDGRTDGRQTTRDHNSTLETSAEVHLKTKNCL